VPENLKTGFDRERWAVEDGKRRIDDRLHILKNDDSSDAGDSGRRAPLSSGALGGGGGTRSPTGDECAIREEREKRAVLGKGRVRRAERRREGKGHGLRASRKNRTMKRSLMLI